tara:strand:- start:339 stop:479 length:141 start_codon:yes stop_codon:yes gene_type:complete
VSERSKKIISLQKKSIKLIGKEGEETEKQKMDEEKKEITECENKEI